MMTRWAVDLAPIKPATMGLLPDALKCGFRMRLECRERFPATDYKENRQLTIPACITARHARAVMRVGIGNPRWWEKRSRHSQRIHNPQFYGSGKRPMCRKTVCIYLGNACI